MTLGFPTTGSLLAAVVLLLQIQPMCLCTNFLANLLDMLKNPLFVCLSKSSRATAEIIP